MKLSNHRIDRSLREAVKDYSPGIPMPWNEISPLIKKKRKFNFLFFLIPALIILSGSAYGLYKIYGIPAEEMTAAVIKAEQQNGRHKSNKPAEENLNLPAIAKDYRSAEAEKELLIKRTERDRKKALASFSGPRSKHQKKSLEAISIVESASELPSQDIENHGILLLEAFSLKVLPGFIQAAAPFRPEDSRLFPRKKNPKIFAAYRFYGGLTFKMETMAPRASFDYDPEKVHEDYEKVSRMQMPLIKSKNYAAEFGYLISSSLGLETGLGLAKYEADFDFNYIYKRAPLYDGSTGKIVGYFDLADTASKKYSIQNTRSISILQVPLNIFYRLPLGRRLYMQASSGLQLNIVTAASGKILDIQELELSELSKKDYKSTLSARVSGGIFYLLNAHSCVGIESSYYTFLNSIYQNDYYMLRPTVKSMQMSFKLNF